MGRRLTFILVCASLTGLLASLLVYRVVARVAERASGESEPIVVAAGNLGLAQTVTRDHVRLVPWPKSSVPPGAVRSVEEAEGHVVRSSMVAGEPLLQGKLAPQLAGRGGIMPMLVPDGARGVTIKVDEAVRESGFVLPNSRVDVLVSMPRAPGSSERVAKLILQGIPVLAAGQSVEMRDSKPVTVTTVTLALRPEEAERLSLAQAEGKLTLATRNLQDDRFVRTPGATLSTLLEDPAPRPVARPARTAAEPSAPRLPSRGEPQPEKVQTHAVAVLRGGKVTEQVFLRLNDRAWVERKGETR